MPEKEIRKLAAVMFTDIAGYTAMVQDDEAAALKKVARYRQILQDCTDKYGGQVIAFYGDGSLSIYPSAIDAVRCGIDMQADYRKAEPVPVRIGLHLGDIVLKDDTVYGNGVNVASRIEAQGVPGAILVSGKIQREVKNQADIHTEFLGAYDLKNVKETIDVYAVVNEGLVVPPKPKSKRFSNKNLQRAAAAIALLFLGGYFLSDAGLLPFLKSADETPVLEERVAVMFADFVKTESLAYVPEMAGRLLIDELLEIPNTKVISYESAVRQAQEYSDNNSQDVVLATVDYASFAAKTGAVNFLDGMVLKTDNGDSLQFRASLKDLSDPDVVIKRFDPVKCSVDDPVVGISKLGSAILGFWASREDKVLTVPNIEAYKAYLRARRAWTEDDELAFAQLQKSIGLDSSFIDPYFLMMDYWINWPNCQRDSAQAIVDLVQRRFDGLTNRHKNLLNYYQADINGDKLAAVDLWENELNIDPLDHFNNTSAIVLAGTYAHDATKVLEFFELIPSDSMDFDECAYCLERMNIAIEAHVSLGDIKSARDLVEHTPLASQREYRSKAMVYAALRDTTALNEIANEWISQGNSAWFANYHVAERFRILEMKDLESLYLNKAQSALGDNSTGWSAMLTKHMMSDFEEANKLNQTFLARSPDNPQILWYEGLLNAKLGNRPEAEAAIQRLESTIASCTDGENRYYQAGIYAHLGDIDQAIEKLSQALKSNMVFTYWAFENDHNIQVLNDDPRYQSLLHPQLD